MYHLRKLRRRAAQLNVMMQLDGQDPQHKHLQRKLLRQGICGDPKRSVDQLRQDIISEDGRGRRQRIKDFAEAAKALWGRGPPLPKSLVKHNDYGNQVFEHNSEDDSNKTGPDAEGRGRAVCHANGGGIGGRGIGSEVPRGKTRRVVP